MGATKKPRKAYRPKPVHYNQVQRSAEAAALIPRSEVARVMAGVREAFEAFRRCEQPGFYWRSMADALNLAESLANEGICSDSDSLGIIAGGQSALASVAERHVAVGSWALRAEEMAALSDALDRHELQLQFASMGEYERAIERTKRRISQALAGNAGAAVIVLGDIGG